MSGHFDHNIQYRVLPSGWFSVDEIERMFRNCPKKGVPYELLLWVWLCSIASNDSRKKGRDLKMSMYGIRKHFSEDMLMEGEQFRKERFDDGIVALSKSFPQIDIRIEEETNFFVVNSPSKKNCGNPYGAIVNLDILRRFRKEPQKFKAYLGIMSSLNKAWGGAVSIDFLAKGLTKGSGSRTKQRMKKAIAEIIPAINDEDRKKQIVFVHAGKSILERKRA